jgi:hypothetical protein
MLESYVILTRWRGGALMSESQLAVDVDIALFGNALQFFKFSSVSTESPRLLIIVNLHLLQAWRWLSRA